MEPRMDARRALLIAVSTIADAFEGRPDDAAFIYVMTSQLDGLKEIIRVAREVIEKEERG